MRKGLYFLLIMPRYITDIAFRNDNFFQKCEFHGVHFFTGHSLSGHICRSIRFQQIFIFAICISKLNFLNKIGSCAPMRNKTGPLEKLNQALFLIIDSVFISNFPGYNNSQRYPYYYSKDWNSKIQNRKYFIANSSWI